jgi:hypothetical protein
VLVDTVLRIHNLRKWFDLSDPATEETLQHMPVFHDFAKLSEGSARLATGAPSTSHCARIKARLPSTATPLFSRCVTRDHRFTQGRPSALTMTR